MHWKQLRQIILQFRHVLNLSDYRLYIFLWVKCEQQISVCWWQSSSLKRAVVENLSNFFPHASCTAGFVPFWWHCWETASWFKVACCLERRWWMVCSFTLESTQLNVLCCSHSWYPEITLDMSPSFFETHVETMCNASRTRLWLYYLSIYLDDSKNHSFLL